MVRQATTSPAPSIRYATLVLRPLIEHNNVHSALNSIIYLQLGYKMDEKTRLAL